MKAATNTISIVSPRLSLPIMLGAVARGDGRQAGHRDLVAGMLPCAPVQRRVELLDHRQQPAGVDVRHAAGHDDRVLLRRDEAARQMLRQQVDILLQGGDVGVAGLLRKPAAQGLQRPDVADAGLLLDHACTSAMVGECLRRIERLALRELDQHVDRIGAGELGVEAAAGGDRLLACRAPGRQAGSAARDWRR